MAKTSSRKKARRSGSAGRGTAVAAKDEGEGGSSGVLDQKEMKRQLMMLSPAERAALLEDVNSNDII